MKYGKLRIAAIHIDCPRPGCGGGVTDRDGSFLLDAVTAPMEVAQARDWICDECKTKFHIPVAASKALGFR